MNKTTKPAKEDQNTPVWAIDRFRIPATSTCVDRYATATTWCKDKTVLDAATGHGYGAGILLSLGAKHVTAIDIDKDAIKQSKERFQSKNLDFKAMEIYDLKKKFNANQFDTVVSIETFEHLEKDRIQEYLSNLRHCAKEVVFITTPKRKTETFEYDGGTHLYEYSPKEFIEEIGKAFPDDKIMLFGIIEVGISCNFPNLPVQFASTYTNNLEESTVMVACVIIQEKFDIAGSLPKLQKI